MWHARRLRSKRQSIWAILAALFVFLSYDELFSVHERLVEPVRGALGTSGLLYFAWVIIYGPGVMIQAALFLPVWWRLEGVVRKWLAFSAAAYLGGAVGLGMLGGARREAAGEGDFVYGVFYTAEESCEMAGLIALSYGLLLLLERETGGLPVIVAGHPKSSDAIP